MTWGSLSRHERGYGKEWDRLRKRILERDCGLCQCKHCTAAGRVTLASEVDHIVSKAKAKALKWTDAQIDDESNLQAINSECHKRKTKEEQGKTARPRVMIGLDGFPIE